MFGYKWQKSDLIAYHSSLYFARANPKIKRDVHLLQFEDMMDKSIDDVHAEIVIKVVDLWALYQCEKLLIPHSMASTRLKVHRAPHAAE